MNELGLDMPSVIVESIINIFNPNVNDRSTLFLRNKVDFLENVQ